MIYKINLLALSICYYVYRTETYVIFITNYAAPMHFLQVCPFRLIIMGAKLSLACSIYNVRPNTFQPDFNLLTMLR